MLRNFNNYIIFESDNPNYKYELYDIVTGVFVCYYISKKYEGKKLPKFKFRENRLFKLPI